MEAKKIDTLQGARVPVAVQFTDDAVIVTLSDGSTVGNPLSWHWWLAEATPEQRTDYELYPDCVLWDGLDEGLDIEGMLRGIKPKQQRPVTN